MNEDLFRYYTGLQFTVNGKDWLAVDDRRFRELHELADTDVKAGRKARSAAEFAGLSEYRIYLSALMGAAFELQRGWKAERCINE
ncbi:MAG: hypothetical protein IKF51_01790 [Solobacterium sp.]|nr:hypothetical protein [Solobacterium sp.]MBR2990178.1 hypothetical protein [Solobacterium sp.]